MNLPKNVDVEKGLVYLSPLDDSFEEKYLAVREKEGRVYSDEIAGSFPTIPIGSKYYSEWMLRAKSLHRLIKYLNLKTVNNPDILDLGCGNGWLCRHLSRFHGAQILGLDINRPELEQAVRLNNSPNCQFAYGDLFIINWQTTFDQIILNSCIQYFPDLRKLIEQLLSILNVGGEMHILDSPIYELSEVENAKARSSTYFNDLGFPDMAAHYFHHDWSGLQKYKAEIKYDPKSLANRMSRILGKKDSPFPWLIIRKKS